MYIYEKPYKTHFIPYLSDNSTENVCFYNQITNISIR